MKNVYARFSLFAISTAFLLTPTLSSAANVNLTYQINFIPYIGASVQGLHQPLVKGFGARVFKKDFPQLNTFAGVRFNDYVAIEGGYEFMPTATRTTNIPAGTSLMGNVTVPNNPQFAPIIQTSRSQVKDWHASLIGLVPVTDIFKLMAGVGTAGVKVFYSTYKVNDPSTSAFNVFSTYASYRSRKTILRLMLGGQLMANNSIGIRAVAGWLNTARFGTLPSLENQLNKIKIKDAWNYGLGVFFEF